MSYSSNTENRLPAEWETQDFVMVVFPNKHTDWNYILAEVERCYRQIIYTIAKYENVLVICDDCTKSANSLGINTKEWQQTNNKSASYSEYTNSLGFCVRLLSIDFNDTWARDFGGVTIMKNGKKIILDFGFNGWGLKFASNYDNMATNSLYHSHTELFEEYEYADCREFILEGGSIESDGKGTILTTTQCLLSENRNYLSRTQMTKKLKKYLGAKRVLWLTKGALLGDDTDSHIDTLARFCDENTIAYVQCNDKTDVHYHELKSMERQIKALRKEDGLPYSLVPLPMADEVMFEGERLPATYANFLIINNAVLVPTYGSDNDKIALQQLQLAFPKHYIVGIDCLPLIKQHGSLHCVTMQFPR